MSLVLHGHPFSSYTWKALIPLYANGTAFEFRALTPGDEEDAGFLRRAHPAGKFPVLVDGDTTVIEVNVDHRISRFASPRPRAADPGWTPIAALTARMLDRVFDNYVMHNMNRIVAAHFLDRDNPMAGVGDPDPREFEAGKAGLRRAYDWLEKWLAGNDLPPHVSLVSCAAAPSLFYADWVERIPDDCPHLKSLRAELLAIPAVSRCVEEARPYRAYFPPGAPDRD